MKKTLLLVAMLFLCAQAVALDSKTVTIEVKVNQPPVIDGENSYPKDGYVINEGGTLQISVTADDANNDILQYRFFINDVVKRDWGTTSTFDYTPEASDIGLNTIKAEVRDGIITVQTDEVEIYIFRSTVEVPQ